MPSAWAAVAKRGRIGRLVAAAALPHEDAAGVAQQVPQRAVELRRHSDRSRFGFAQCGDLQEQ
jgi:hypothetical protein